MDNVLETLDLQQHSLGILAVLCAKFSLPNTNSGNNDAPKVLFNQVQEFIIGCNGEQVRFAPDTCECIESSIILSINVLSKFYSTCNKFICCNNYNCKKSLVGFILVTSNLASNFPNYYKRKKYLF